MHSFAGMGWIPDGCFQITGFFIRELINRDVGSKSDPVCVLYMREKGTNEFIEVGRTEQLNDDLNPVWQKKFTLEYRFEERQVSMSFFLYSMFLTRKFIVIMLA